MELKAGDTINNGQYKVIGILGKGAYGQTYVAKNQHRFEAQVVIKKLIPSTYDQEIINDAQIRFRREAQMLYNMGEHPQIPSFQAHFKYEEQFFLVQEYIDGRSLRNEIGRNNHWGEKQVIKFLEEILPILSFVHGQGVIHRDIKPSNLMRRKSDDKIFLIDFGSVKEIHSLYKRKDGLIAPTMAIGTEGYMAPEQFKGVPKYNSDIYSLGIVCIEAITKINPREQSNIIHSDLLRILLLGSNIKPDLANILCKMVEFNFRDRYQTVKEIKEDLSKIILLETNNNASQSKFSFRFIRAVLSKLKFKLLARLIITALIFTTLIIDNPWKKNSITSNSNPACELKEDDSISCGEEILNPNSYDIYRQNAAKEFAQTRYQKALPQFEKSWEISRDAETLIYMNNTVLQVLDADYYTIVVAVPLSFQGIKATNYKLAEDFLRGVALAQTEINLSLLDSYHEIGYILPGQNFLERKKITNGKKFKGLRIIIVDDQNNPEHTSEVAEQIAHKPEILGVLGHYASNISLAAVDQYKKKDLNQVSFGTTTIDLTDNPRANYFRVVYTNKEEADAMVDAINKLDEPNEKIAVFYNPGSQYSADFWGEIQKAINKHNKEVSTQNKIAIIEKNFNLVDKYFNTNLAYAEAKRLGANIFLLLPDGQTSDALAHAIEIIDKDNGNTPIFGGNPLMNEIVEQINTPKIPNVTAITLWHYLDNPKYELTKNFIEDNQRLWGTKVVNPGTATAYDATLAFIEAIKQQKNPARKGTLEKLSDSNFSVQGVTGEIKFNTAEKGEPRNGDRRNFEPTTVKLRQCGDKRVFIPIETDCSAIE